jgi:threonine dehydrogenase-like Zn-dependent dehydrogenase
VKAVVYRGLDEVRVQEVPDPAIAEPDDAIVRVTTASICGSDLHFFHGKAPLEPGETIGHEAVGVVEAVGAAVERFRVGDRVVVAFNIACGRCWFCRRGQTHLCEDFRNLGAGIFGGGLGGAQAERLRVPRADFNLLLVPGGMADEQALFAGDILTTGFHGASIAGIRPGDSVAVVGAGPVGFFCVQAALAGGAGEVLSLDLEPGRLALTEQVGAVPVNVSERHPQMAVAERTDGRGADVVIEAVGNAGAFGTAVDIARRGGVVTVVGMFTGETAQVPLGFWWARALSIRFSGVCPIHSWWEEALAEVSAGRIDPTPIVSHRLPLEEASIGYELFASRRATKVLLLP